MTKAQPPPGRPLLVRIDSGWGLTSKCYPLSKGPVTVIGREPTADVPIPMEVMEVSREHALIRLSEDHYVLEHRSVRNPTRIIRHDQPFSPSKPIDLNKPGEEEALKFDDIIVLAGTIKLKFISDHAGLDTQQSDGPKKLLVVLSADAVKSSVLVSENNEMTRQRIEDCYREIFGPEYLHHHGNHIERVGDGILVTFSLATDAISYAKAVQHKLVEFNSHLPVSQQIHFRIGCHLGEIIFEGGANPGEVVSGDAVNLAERIQKEKRAEPGGVMISGLVYDLLDRPAARAEFRRVGTLENVDRIVELYQLIRASSV